MVYFNEIIRIFGLRLLYRRIIRNVIFKQDVTWFILMRLLEFLVYVYFIDK